MEADEEKQGTLVKDALKADSVAVLLSQALQAQDRALLERCAELALRSVPQEQPALLLSPSTVCTVDSTSRCAYGVQNAERRHAELSHASSFGLSSAQVPGGEE